MQEMPVDIQMKRGDIEYLYSDKVACCKWFDRLSVTKLFSNDEGMATIPNVPRQQKGSASKIQVPFPNIIKVYNKGTGGVDLIDQRASAYHLDRKLIRFYLRIFFNIFPYIFSM